jgi:predicted negative regulator of RcsB-dependent stress response
MTKTGTQARPLFEDGADGLLDWARVNARMLTIAGVAVVVVGGGLLVWKKTRDTQAERADTALMAARQTHASGNLPLAKTDLERLVQRYGSTSAGRQASLLLAQIAYDQGKPDDGLRALEGVPTSGPLGPAALALRGAGLEQQGKFEEAARQYVQASSEANVESEKNAYKARAAKAYTAAAKPAEAERLWVELQNSGDPFYAEEADLRLGEIRAKPAK